MDFDARLREIEERFEQVQAEMASPEVARDPERLRTLGRDFAELQEIVVTYREYLSARQQA